MISPYFGLNLPPLAPPAPPCIQAASVLFFAAALFGDQLVVRILLALAYGALALEGSVVALARDDWLENDTFFWAVLTGGLHAFAFSRLYREARANGTETEAEDPDAAALERFLRRRTGASATDARRLREIGRRVSYAPNDIICRTSESREHLYLVVEGVVRAEFKYEGDALVRSIQLASGESVRRADSPPMNRGAAAAATGIVRGDGSRRRGRDVDIPRSRVAATQRTRRDEDRFCSVGMLAAAFLKLLEAAGGGLFEAGRSKAGIRLGGRRARLETSRRAPRPLATVRRRRILKEARSFDAF